MYTKMIQRGILLAVAVVVVAGVSVVAQAQVPFPSRGAQVFAPKFTTGGKFSDSAGRVIGPVQGTDKVWRFLTARGESIKFEWRATGTVGGSTQPLPYCMNSFNASNGATGEVSGYFNADTDIRIVCSGVGGGVGYRVQAKVGDIDLTIPSVSVDGTRAQDKPQGTFRVSQNLPVTVTGNVKNIGEAPLRNYEVEVVFSYSLAKDNSPGAPINLTTFKTVGKGETIQVPRDPVPPMTWVPPSTLFDKDVFIKACILEGTGPLYYEQLNGNDKNNCSDWFGPWRFIPA